MASRGKNVESFIIIFGTLSRPMLTMLTVTADRYSDYISVSDASNLIRIPESMPLELAAMLPCGGLAAFSAVQRVKPFILEKLHNSTG